MEPGSDEAYRKELPADLAYEFNNSWHGKTPKRTIEGPQICTKAGQLSPRPSGAGISSPSNPISNTSSPHPAN